MDVKDQIELIKLATETGAVVNPAELRELLEDAGLGVREDYAQQTDQYWNGGIAPMEDPGLDPLYSDYAGIGGGPIPDNFTNQVMGQPPNDDPIYNDMIQNVRGPNPATENNPFVPNPYSAQPSDPRLNFTEIKRRRQ